MYQSVCICLKYSVPEERNRHQNMRHLNTMVSLNNKIGASSKKQEMRNCLQIEPCVVAIDCFQSKSRQKCHIYITEQTQTG